MPEPNVPPQAPPTDLSQVRQQIDSVDRELVRLLDERARLGREVARAKAAKGGRVYEPFRHQHVIERAIRFSNGTFPAEGLRQVFREILSVSLAIQGPLRIGYLGPEGTFSHEAAVRTFGHAVSYVACSSIHEIFVAACNEQVHYGIVPIENSMGGVVANTIDNFQEFRKVQILQERRSTIHQHLIGTGSLAEIKRVYSHPQGFLQCAMWLRKNLPDAERVELSSTAAGVTKVRKQPTQAAISSQFAADRWHVPIIAHKIEDSPNNTTRFLIIASDTIGPPQSSESDWPASRTSLLCIVENKPGTLHSLLKPFAESGLNLTMIEPRPTRDRAWEYCFFLDFDGHADEPRVRAALDQLRQLCTTLRVLGSYPRDPGAGGATATAAATPPANSK